MKPQEASSENARSDPTDAELAGRSGTQRRDDVDKQAVALTQAAAVLAVVAAILLSADDRGTRSFLSLSTCLSLSAVLACARIRCLLRVPFRITASARVTGEIIFITAAQVCIIGAATFLVFALVHTSPPLVVLVFTAYVITPFTVGELVWRYWQTDPKEVQLPT